MNKAGNTRPRIVAAYRHAGTAGIALISTRRPDIDSTFHFEHFRAVGLAGRRVKLRRRLRVAFFIAHDFDQNMLPARDEQLAIQAKLNMLLGAELYDALFLGFECGVIFEDVVHVYVPSADAAIAISIAYPTQVAQAVASVMKLPISDVHVLPRNYSDV